MTQKIRAALFIDADNLPLAQATEALGKLEEICTPVIRKAFGDFTKSAKNWDQEFLQKNGITPVQHFPVTNFKNGADIAMTIAVMETLHAKTVDAIVLFTSDSDFGALAAKVREADVEVIGIGDEKAKENFQAFFNTFIVVKKPEAAKSEAIPEPKKVKVDVSTQQNSQPVLTTLKAVEDLILTEINSMVKNGGSVQIEHLRNRLKKNPQKFVYKDIGMNGLVDLLKKSSRFNVSPKANPTTAKPSNHAQNKQ